MDVHGKLKGLSGRTLAIVAGAVVLPGALLLVYESRSSPCESIFKQTSSQFKLKLKTIGSEGEVLIGQAKIQELTEKAQQTGLNLKTCCAVLDAGKLDAERFLRCKNQALGCEERLDRIILQLEEAKAAERQGASEVVAEKVRQIHKVIGEVTREAEVQEREVAVLRPTPPVPPGDRRAANACDTLIGPSGPLPAGGTSFEQAPDLVPGRFLLTRELVNNQYLYYKVNLTAGQTLRIRFRTPDHGSPEAGTIVYNSDGGRLKRANLANAPGAIQELVFDAETDGLRYVSVGDADGVNAGAVYCFAVY